MCAQLADARSRSDVHAQAGVAYSLYMTTGQTAVTDPQNMRDPDITTDTFGDVASRALASDTVSTP